MQAVGVPPNIASAEALIQSCCNSTHLSDRVNTLIAPFQPALAAQQLTQMSLSPDFRFTNPALAAAQLLAENKFSNASAEAAQSILAGQPASPSASPSASHARPAPLGWRSRYAITSEQMGHIQSFEAGPMQTEPSTGLLSTALESGAMQSAALEPAAPEKEMQETASGSGPSTGAPVTPVAHSESAEMLASRSS